MALPDKARILRFDFSPLRIAATYAVLGGLWILWSDKVVEAIVRDPAMRTYAQTAKGWFFVVASAGLLYALIERRLRALRLAERQEREARATLEAMIDASPYAVFTLDPHGHVASWNAGAERLFGQSAQEMLGCPLTGADVAISLGSREVHDELGTLVSHALQGVVGTGYAPRPAPRGHGANVREELRLVAGPIGSPDRGVHGVVVFARDATDERTSARERARLVAVLEATSDLVAIFTPDGSPRYVNPAGRRLLGVPDDAPLSQYNVRDFIDPRDAAQADEVQLIAFERGVYELERTVRRTDGTLIPVSQVLVVHRGEEGAVEFVSTIIRDLSERLKQEAVLRQSQKMEAVGRLAGGVAHDFNNLLTVILGCAEVLRETLREGAGRDDAEEIVQAAQRAARLTRQLLAYSRQQVLAVDSVDVNEVVRNLLAMLRRLVGDHVTIEESLDPRTPSIRADRGQFEQVIVNLVVNARDAMPEGGTISIRSRATGHGATAAAELTVRDTGIGMDDETRARVFEPFFTTKALGGGTGLGLATVYGIVKQSGGEIGVESAPGRGATFRITLPAEKRTAEPRPDAMRVTPTAMAAPAPRERHVLVVEDDTLVRRTAVRMLLEDGWVVTEAGSAEEAVRAAAGIDALEVVLTDVEMPNGNGRELALQLSGHPSAPYIVFMSGYTTDALLLRGSLPPNASFVAKPFTSESLRGALREAAAAREARERPAQSR